MPVALVISDFPIIASTAVYVLKERFEVITQTWASYLEDNVRSADMVLVDSTTLPVAPLLRLVYRSHPGARVVVCSLHHNEVHVYRAGYDGLEVEEALPSLLVLNP